MIDYRRLIYLDQKIKTNTATKAEKDEYMLILFKNGNITQQQYNDYLKSNGSVSEDVLKAALAIGGVLLLVYLLDKLLD